MALSKNLKYQYRKRLEEKHIQRILQRYTHTSTTETSYIVPETLIPNP